MLLMDPEEFDPKVTASLKLAPYSPTNEFHSTTEDIAITRVDSERKRKIYIAKINNAVNRLNYDERAVIINRYLDSDDVFVYEVYNGLGYSERKYYRVKVRAFYKLALILKIEVYKEESEDELCAAGWGY